MYDENSSDFCQFHDTETARTWGVRILRFGDYYGEHNADVWGREDPCAEVYDRSSADRSSASPQGLLIARIPVDSLMSDMSQISKSSGLNISTDTLEEIRMWLADRVSNQEMDF